MALAEVQGGRLNHHAGLAAEAQVAAHFMRAGLAVRERRWRGPGGEIDLICGDADGLVFVEVKKARDHAGALARVTPRQLDRIRASAEAYAALNRYLRTGGMILFDTRDADVAGFGGTTPEGRRLQELAAQLDVPPLEPVPADHVLTRTFYLLQDFPGRHAGRAIWVEASPPDAEQVEGMPFRNLNDGVTPVVIGGNDWASAWAADDSGLPLYPVGRGFAGERQREIAYRFGINLIMHVLTGNYKSDQVHVPALLERLGQ